jgi:hypothetical protein
MPHELKRLVDLRQWREHEALRALSAQRDALRQTKQQRENERLAMQRIEESARNARDQLCGGTAVPMKAADAQLLLNFAASRRHRARDALLGVRRADAEVAQAQQRVKAAHDAWQQRARAHTKMRHQNDELTRIEAVAAMRRSEDALADEHLEGWMGRRPSGAS